MISQSTMRYHANRTFALAELLDATYEQAFQAANEGTDDPDTVIERLKGLLFCAHEIADNLAGDLDRLIEKAEPVAPVAPKPVLSSDDLHSLGLFSWAHRALCSGGIHTVSQLTGLTEIDLIAAPLVGPKTIKEVKSRLAANGLSLSARGAA